MKILSNRLIFWAGIVILSIVLACIFDVSGVDVSMSMAPTLITGDILTISKADAWIGRTLHRGDIVEFYPQTGAQRYVKRIIGLPGDRIQIVNNQVILNRVPLALIDKKEIGDGLISATEQMPGHSYTIWLSKVRMPQADTPEFYVPKGRIFVLGDYRDNSDDSRFFYPGMPSLSSIYGRVILRIWNLNPHNNHIFLWRGFNLDPAPKF